METNHNVATDDRIRTEVKVSNLEVSRVYAADYQKEGTLTAEIKQTVETKSFYPSKSVSNDKQDNIFDAKDYDFAEQEFTATDTRVAWIPVPTSMDTPAKVVAQLKKFPESTIYKVLANRPILTTDQKYAVNVSKQTTMEIIGERQAIRYPDTYQDATLRGKLILDKNGKIQYRAAYFANKAKADEDARTADPTDFWASEALMQELEETSQRTI